MAWVRCNPVKGNRGGILLPLQRNRPGKQLGWVEMVGLESCLVLEGRAGEDRLEEH